MILALFACNPPDSGEKPTDADGDGVTAEIDCDDADAEVSDIVVWYGDGDADGFGDARLSIESCEAPAGFVADDSDCDDDSADAHPGGSEVCDQVDNDCDGLVDNDASDAPTWYLDADHDGYGGDEEVACEAPDYHLAQGGDCDDGDPEVNPGATESCNDTDDDCDGEADEDAADAGSWYADSDNDGYGAGDATVACDAPADTVDNADDCNDGDSSAYPGGEERCDDVDDDCDGVIDDEAVDMLGFFTDGDGDGWGDAYVLACDQPEGTVLQSGDCDDADAAVSPDAVESCNDTDDDCDGETDEEAYDADGWYGDGDGDGYGAGELLSSCDQPEGFVATDGDCDDADADVNPGATERCDEVDEDCDGETDEEAVDMGSWYYDVDGDGYGGEVWTACTRPDDAVDLAGDCDDADFDVAPGNLEHCDEVDEDCDGEIDEDPVDGDSWYTDADGDGVGGASASGCDRPAEAVDGGGDCDDADPEVHPDAIETCDGLDEDCDGSADDDAVDQVSTFYDADGDGHGDPDITDLRCDEGDGWVLDGDDCDDADPSLYADCPVGCDLLVSYPGDVTFTGFGAGDDMADFCASYNAIDGDLNVTSTDSASLDGLDCLCEIGDKLSLKGNSTLSSLSGLSSLRRIGGNLSLDDNDSLVDLEGLGALEEIGGGIESFSTNASLTSFAGLDSLWHLGSLSFPSAFTSTAGLEALTTIDGRFSLFPTGSLDLGGLGSLSTVGGDFYLYGSGITDLSPLASLTSVGGDLSFDETGLVSLVGLEALQSVGGELLLSNAPVSSLDGLDALGSAGSLRISGCDDLADLSALGALTETRSLEISTNAGLSDLTGLEGLTTLESLSLSDLDVLTSLTGLDNLVEVSGDVDIENNDLLPDLGGLDALQTVGGSLRIRNHGGLASLDGLGALTAIGSQLTVTGNTVDDFEGLEALTTLGGNLMLGGTNPASADGLGALTSIGGTLTIGGDVSGLGALQTVGGLSTSGSSAWSTDGLSALETVTGDVYLYSAAWGSGLDALTTVGGVFYMTNCPDAPADLGIAPSLRSVGGNVELIMCAAPTTMTGLAALEEVGGSLDLSWLSGLSHLPDWTNLHEVNRLELYGNGFVDLDGLSGLTGIGTGGLAIAGHPVLDDLTGLYGVTHIDGGGFSMYSNTLISGAEAFALRDEIGTANIVGTISITE